MILRNVMNGDTKRIEQVLFTTFIKTSLSISTRIGGMHWG